MHEKQLLILDCHDEPRPAICFSLEIAGYDIRVVTKEDEAINLLDNARITDQKFLGLLVNNPYLNVDITSLVEEIDKIDQSIPILFIKDSVALKEMIREFAGRGRPGIYHAEPTRVVEMLTMLGREDASAKNDARTVRSSGR